MKNILSNVAKKIGITLTFIVALFCNVHAYTPHIVPNGDMEANIGTPQKRWAAVNASSANVGSIIFTDGSTQTTAYKPTAAAGSYRFLIGTSTARGANYVGNTNAIFTTAIADALALSNSSDTVMIMVQHGSYTFTSPVFVPYNITIQGEDHGAICYNNNGGGGIFDIEGRVTNMGFVSKAWSYGGSTNDRIIAMKWRGRFDHNKFHSISSAQAFPYSCTVQVRASSYTECNDNEFLNAMEDYSPIYLLMNTSASPSNTPAKFNNFLRNKIEYIGTNNSNAAAIGIYYGSYNRIEYNQFYLVKTSVWWNIMPYSVTEHEYGNIFSNNYISCNLQSGAAVRTATDYYGMGISTGTEFNNNRFDVRVPGNPVFAFTNDTSGIIQNVTVSGNVAISTTSYNGYFMTTDGNTKRCVIKNNTVNGFQSFISDGGGNYYTPYKNNDLNGVNQ